MSTLQNSEAHNRTHNSSQLICILNEVNPFHLLPPSLSHSLRCMLTLPIRLLPALRKCTFPSCFPAIASLSGVLHVNSISSSSTWLSQWRLVNHNLWSLSRLSFIRHLVISLHVRSKYSPWTPSLYFLHWMWEKIFTLIQMCRITVLCKAHNQCLFRRLARK